MAVLAVGVVSMVAMNKRGMAIAEGSSQSERPLKVFILAGQSNMQGHAHVRTLDVMALDPETAPLLEAILQPDGSPREIEEVWISSIGSAPEEKFGRLTVGYGASGGGPKIGPELTFGIFMQKHLNEPILIIKTAWGGKSLHTDFRPPSAGPYELNESELRALERQGKDIETVRAERAEASGHYYRLMMDHVRHVLSDIDRVYPDYNAENGFELAGFVWFQGWNDMVDGGVYPNRDQPGGYDLYSELLAQFIRDVRAHLEAPNLPFVIGVMGVGGPIESYGPDQQRYKGVHANFRNAMAAPAKLPEFAGSVVAVQTAPFWDMEVVELRERENQIKPQIDELNRRVKDGELNAETGKAAIERLYVETFTPRELVILRESTSNADFHYMGSAKIMTRIGRAFAEGMASAMRQVTLETSR